jgi:two-component system sensor histidine kinase YesM
MHKFFQTLKGQLSFIVILFTLVITILVTLFSYSLISRHQKEVKTQSIDFNLQLVKETVQQDLIESMSLASWSCHYPSVVDFLSHDYSGSKAVTLFNRVQNEELRNNRAYRYINRLLITSTESRHVVHVGIRSTISNHDYLKDEDCLEDHFPVSSEASFINIAQDPYDRLDQIDLNITGQIYSLNKSDEIVGTVYLALNPAIITNALKGYALEADENLYLLLNNQLYQLNQSGKGSLFNPQKIKPVTAEENTTLINELTNPDYSGQTYRSIEIRDNMSLIHSLGSQSFKPQISDWFYIILALILLICILGLALGLVMDRLITRPVAKIQQKLKLISQGDFSPDPSIESGTEIGSIGKGINQLSHEVQNLMDQRLANQREQKELEYRMLQSQINPHFLYNTLGTIKWMASLQKATGISDLTTALARLLRKVSKDTRKEVTLREELELLDDYFTLLQYRYGGNLDYKKEIEDPNLLETMVPRFILQPLMENAVFHGIEPKGKGEIRLKAQIQDKNVRISFFDNGIGMPRDQVEKINHPGPIPNNQELEHFGIQNVNNRIRNYYGLEYGLSVKSVEGQYTEIEILLPYVTNEDKDEKN